jgi:hypothetical protein
VIESSHAGTVRLAVHLVGWRTHVKFYRRSFFDVVEDEEGRFEGFSERRRLGAAAAGHRHRPEPAAAVT